MPLTGNQRRYLRGLAHHRDAIVQVGHQGVTEPVLKALEQALEDHELVKVRLAQAVEDREAAADALVAGSSSECVQTLGRTVLLYRPRAKKPDIVLPKPRRQPAGAVEATPAPAVTVAAAVAAGDDEDDDDAGDDDEA